MKKIFFTLIFSIIINPAIAVCSITGGACSTSGLELPSLDEKLVPNNLNNIGESNNVFQGEGVKSYDIKMIRTDNASSNPQANDYNADCQFGVCLPNGYHN